MLISSIVASVVLLILQKVSKGEKGKEYPFAPFLVLGFLVAIFLGDIVVNAYSALLAGV